MPPTQNPSAPGPTHYDLLEVESTASVSELRQAFRQLSKRYHPDTTSLPQALRLAIEVETLARMYLQALQLGEPPVLDAAQMAAVQQQFTSLLYGA